MCRRVRGISNACWSILLTHKHRTDCTALAWPKSLACPAFVFSLAELVLKKTSCDVAKFLVSFVSNKTLSQIDHIESVAKCWRQNVQSDKCNIGWLNLFSLAILIRSLPLHLPNIQCTQNCELFSLVRLDSRIIRFNNNHSFRCICWVRSASAATFVKWCNCAMK